MDIFEAPGYADLAKDTGIEPTSLKELGRNLARNDADIFPVGRQE